MTDWHCPNCRGGFPEPVHDGLDNTRKCPWCGESIDGSYEHKPVTRPIVRSKENDESQSLLGMLRS